MSVKLKGGYLVGQDGREYLVVPNSHGTVLLVWKNGGVNTIRVSTKGMPTGEEQPSVKDIEVNVTFEDLLA